MYIVYNPNPSRKLTGDCVIRAITLVMNSDWKSTYMNIALQGYMMDDMPSSNSVWGAYLYSNGFNRYIIPNTCPACYTVKDFCRDNPKGTFLLSTGSHAIGVKNGNYYDSWDSGDEVPIYYWRKET